MRTHFAALSSVEAKAALSRYERFVRWAAGTFPSCEYEDLLVIGRTAVLEALGSLDERKSSEATWVQKVVRWRMQQAIQKLPHDYVMTGRADTINGREIDCNPELSYLRTLVLDGLRSLSPRKSTIILARMDGDTLQEIADSLGISVQRTHVEYQEAIMQLQKLVAG